MAVHPSLKMLGLAKTFLLIALVLSVIALVMPSWSRIKGATGITPVLSSLAYTTAAVSSDSTLYAGLWQWCLHYDSHSYTCGNINTGDANAVTFPYYTNSKCKGMFLATRYLSIITVVLLFLALIALAVAVKKLATWNPTVVFKAPKVPTLAAILLTLLALGCAIAAWACWFILGETACRPTTTRMDSNWNPFQGYSGSFICMCIASGIALLALLTAILGFLKLKKAPKALPEIVYKQEYPVVIQTEYPVTQYVEQSYLPAQATYPTTY